MITYVLLLCSALRASLRYRQHLVLENLALRQQLAVLTRQSRRPKLQPADRLFWSFLSQLWSRWRSAMVLVQPDLRESPLGQHARAGPPRAGRIIARPVLGGPHHEYEWLAA